MRSILQMTFVGMASNSINFQFYYLSFLSPFSQFFFKVNNLYICGIADGKIINRPTGKSITIRPIAPINIITNPIIDNQKSFFLFNCILFHNSIFCVFFYNTQKLFAFNSFTCSSPGKYLSIILLNVFN